MQGEKGGREGEGEREVGETRGATHEHDVTRHDRDDDQRVEQNNESECGDKKGISASEGPAAAEKEGCRVAEEGRHNAQPSIGEGTAS
jgi:hypothetical protein